MSAVLRRAENHSRSIIFNFANPFNPDDMGGGLLGMFDSFVNEFTFKGLFYEITEAIKILILPSLLAVLIVLHSVWGKLSLDIVREYKSAWVASLVLLFSLNAIFSAADTLFQDTIIRLMIIPLMPSESYSGLGVGLWIVIILGSIGSLLLTAFFYPAFALALVMPFRYEEERLSENAVVVAEFPKEE